MTRGQKILFLGLETFSKTGGIQQFNQRLIRALVQRAQTTGVPKPTAVLRRDHPGDLPDLPDVEVRACGHSPMRFLYESQRAAKGADVVIAGHINLLPAQMFCRLSAPHARRILIAHGDEVWGDPTYRKTRWFDRLLLRQLDAILPVSQFTAKRMAACFSLPAEQFKQFQNAVDPLDPSHETRRRRDPKHILTVTRLGPFDGGKNIDLLLRAFTTVRDTQPEARLTIVGDGVLRPQLMRLSDRLGVAGSVHFAGRLGNAGLVQVYENASIFVLPSEKEGFGIVFLEAWQHGLPVICSDRDAAQEIIDHGQDGFAVSTGSPADLAARITQLLRDPDRAQQMGQAGRQKVRDRYLMPQFQTRLDQILTGVSG